MDHTTTTDAATGRVFGLAGAVLDDADLDALLQQVVQLAQRTVGAPIP